MWCVRGLFWICCALGWALALPAHGQVSDSATYRVTFEATWSAESHPEDFPARPHFSSLIGGVHGDAASFWRPGELSTPGIQSMAETGGTFTLGAEVQAAIAQGRAASVVRGGGVGVSPGTATAELTVTLDQPPVTLVSMIAPSPDWFVGVAGLSLLASPGGDWLLRHEVPLFAWDAGTDSGASFGSPNAATIPAQPIALIDRAPLEDHAPMGRFVFERLNVPRPQSLTLGPGAEGRFVVTAIWRTPSGETGFGMPSPLTADTGTFWFFDPANVEVVVKVLDACSFSGHHWVFAAGLTDVEVVLEVRDTVAGTTRTYVNTLGAPFAPIQDTRAFAGCP